MINGDSKVVNNRHVQFGSITSSERAVLDAGFPIGNVW